MQLALKFDVETYSGTREGIPNLLELLKPAEPPEELPENVTLIKP